MDIKGFATLALEQLPFEPTDQQIKLVAALSRFCSAYTPQDTVFVLNGYAGTGKTSVMGALVRTLRIVGIPTVLLASTGRAAKVFSNFTGQPAYTIHRKIYAAPVIGADGRLVSRLTVNPHVNTVFIVDEASMIGDSMDGGAGLLQDLLMYVYSGINCRLILLGDTAQLPPVGLAESPAMDPQQLKSMGMRVTRAVMTRTVRQKSRSGILYNATWLRHAMIQSPLPEPQMWVSRFPDVEVVSPEDLEDILQKSFAQYGEGETLIITRSNKRAVDFNLAVRRVIFDRDEVLVKGDRLIVARNNYYWTRRSVQQKESDGDAGEPPRQAMEFVANGEAAVVDKVYSTETRNMMEFADVRLYFPDYDVSINAKLNLDTLVSEGAYLSREKQQMLVDQALADAGVPQTASVTAQREVLKADPYYNALQVKYAYAVTCHKAQGGQWKSVFVDMGYIPPDAYTTPEFYRWLYTATSRATERLTLINPSVQIN